MRRERRAWLQASVFLGLVGLMACSRGTSEPADVPSVTGDVSAAARSQGRVLRVSDSVLVAYAGVDARDIARAGLPRDATGLIGRNREWGQMYAARFQMGTGAALRMALTTRPIVDGVAEAQAAFLGVETGVQGMDADGRLAARVPISVSLGQEAAPVDVASGAAFFLGDACMGLLSLEATDERDAIASAERRRALRARLVQSIRWLTTQSSLLLNGDRRAPNRLLFDARAYQACGALADDSTIRAAADIFVAEWRRSLTPGGWFLEDNGWDTSYQAVSLDIGSDVAVLTTDGDDRTAIFAALSRAATWLAARVSPDGRVDSGGNARTCSGGESFLGVPKSLALTSVVIGLARVAVQDALTINGVLFDASRRVSGWGRRNLGADPCFAGIG